MSDYLWDRSGEPDEDIARLEALLAPYAHRGRPPQFDPVVRSRRALRIILPLLTAAASIALVVAAARVAISMRQAGWGVSATSGAPIVAGAPVSTSTRLPVG